MFTMNINRIGIYRYITTKILYACLYLLLNIDSINIKNDNLVAQVQKYRYNPAGMIYPNPISIHPYKAYSKHIKGHN